MSDPREEALAHFGVRGMKWGVRKSIGSSGGSSSGSTTTKKVAPPKITKAQAAQKAEADAQKAKARMNLGKSILKTTLITAGSIAVASVAGPLAGSATAAIGREVMKAFETDNSYTVRTSDGITTINAPDSRPTSGWGKNQDHTGLVTDNGRYVEVGGVWIPRDH